MTGGSPGPPPEGAPGTGSRLPIDAASATDIGLVREENEDTCAVVPIERGPAAGGVLAIVADGMGGLSSGATASRIVVEAAGEAMRKGEGEPGASLVEAVRLANALIYRRSAETPGGEPMGTTATAALVGDGRAWIAHVGDSRAYLLRRSENIRRLTRDHTWVEELSRRGEIEPGSFQYSLNRSILTRGIGLRPEVEVDLEEIGDVKPGDTFILCSDGLHEMLGDAEMEGLARLRGADIRGMAGEFIRIARDRGAPDNITVVILRVGERPPPADRQEGTGPSGGGTSRPSRGGLVLLSLFLAFVLGVAAVIVLANNEEEKIAPPALELPPGWKGEDPATEKAPPSGGEEGEKTPPRNSGE